MGPTATGVSPPDWDGVVVHQDTVRGLMRRAGLVAAWPRRKVRTTTLAEDLGVRSDLVERNFTASSPGLKWVGDITCIRTWAGLAYLDTILDCATKKVVGYAMADPCTHLPGVRGHRYGRA